MFSFSKFSRFKINDMKIQIIHDKQGEIKSISIPSKHSKFTSGVIVSEGLDLSEVETAHKELNEENDIELAKNFRVDKKSYPPKLVAKKEKK